MAARTRWLVAGAAVVLTGLLWYLFLLRPATGRLSEARRELTSARQEEQRLQLELARLKDLERRAPELQRRLDEVGEKIPPTPDLPGLIRLLQGAADGAHVDLTSITASAPSRAAQASVTSIDLSLVVVGGFFQIDDFLARLENLPRAALVRGVNLGAGPRGLPQLQATVQVRVFTSFLPSASPTPGPSPAGTPSPTPSPTGAGGLSPGGSPSPTVGQG